MADAPALAGLTVSGDIGPWAAAGFAVEDDHLTIGTVRLHPSGTDQPAGIEAWRLTGVDDGSIDGLATLAHLAHPVHDGPLPPPPTHPNTATAIDHLVVASPDLDRTTEALGAVGIELRRVRDAGRMEQRFFRLGEVVLELVGAPGAHGPGPASFWGLALTVGDLDRSAALLGGQLGPVTDAVQPGRRIATLRHEALGLPVRVAFLSAPPTRARP